MDLLSVSPSSLLLGLVQMEETQGNDNKLSGNAQEGSAQEKHETRDEMLARHRCATVGMCIFLV